MEQIARLNNCYSSECEILRKLHSSLATPALIAARWTAAARSQLTQAVPVMFVAHSGITLSTQFAKCIQDS